MTEEPISGAFCYADSIIIARLKAEVERWRTKAKDANAALHNERAAITRREAEVRAEALEEAAKACAAAVNEDEVFSLTRACARIRALIKEQP